MSEADKGPLYRCAPREEMVLRPLDGLTLVYHRRSGQTHIVAEPMPEIIECLAGGPMDARALADLLAERYEIAAEDEAEGQADTLAVVEARLAELAALGLVERS